MNNLNLSDYPIIDNHTHPFPAKRESADFYRNFSIGLYPVSAENMKNTLYCQMMMNELRRLYQMPLASDEEIIKHRNKLAFSDRRAYTQMLWKDAGYVAMLVDFGYPVGQKHDKTKKLKPEEIQDMYDVSSPVKIYSIDRIEWIANDLIEEGTPFDEFERKFNELVRQMVESKHLIALKSIIAYYTGLEVKVLPKSEVRTAYQAFSDDRKNSDAEKVVRDYTFLLGCHMAHELDIPLQIHTGLGDSPDCNLLKCNPFLLYDAINLPEVRETKLMLIHGGYPYLEELGMLLNHYENIYADISSLCPYASIAAEDKLLKLFELAPLNKVCFGTDGGSIPEHTWFGAVYLKRILGKVLQSLVDKKYISYEFAETTAKNILYQNVNRIYKLDKKV